MANTDRLNRGGCIFALIFCAAFIVASGSEECAEEDDLYAIRNIATDDLALDAADPEQLKVQHFNGSKAQLWKLKPADRIGFYFIVNEHHGKVLDFIRKDDGNLKAAVTEPQQSLQQQWHLSIKGHIVNAVNQKNIDIVGAIYTPGNPVSVWEDNGCACQRFNLHLQKNVL